GYLQRYCAKNDTIGFFGPFGFADVVPGAPPLTSRPGPGLLKRRRVYFEHWCIDALAAALSADPALRAWARPRRMPPVWLEGTTVHYGFDRQSEIPPSFARVLAACDGDRRARDIARDLAPELELTEADVIAMLGELADKQLCTWTLEIPTATMPPERFEDVLRRLLDE